MDAAELEISLHRWDAERYAVELRFRQPGNDAELAPVRGLTRFDLASLRASRLDVAQHGRLLAASLFTPGPVRECFLQARAVADAGEQDLRVRLFIGPSAPELHAMRWETLADPADPENGRWLVVQENVFFSRFLGSHDWRPVRLRPSGRLRALAVIANPTGLEKWSLAPVGVEEELRRARAGLGEIPLATLPPGTRATLDGLIDALREEEHDILYLACHGALMDDDPWLFLEDKEGGVARVGGSDLVERLGDLEQRPRLVVLASCESAGTGEEGDALAAIGPRLAEAGIPAVLTMQGRISMETVEALLPVFFRELQQEGRIDRALAVARSVVRDQPDSWMPTLFLRLSSGRIWYQPGFAEEGKFQRWRSLLNNIEQGRCTPILGSGLLEELVGSSQEVARRWAENHRFPMAPHDREDLPQVAQYLATVEEEPYLRDALVSELRRELTRRYGRSLQEKLPGTQVQQFMTALSRVGAGLRERNAAEPHKVLASLPFPLYISTNPDSLLADALREAGRSPQVELCRWRDDVEWPASIYDQPSSNYQPTPDQPLVYHLFGSFQELDSIVLTEDNYFDYLIGVTRPGQDSPHPPVVLKAQTASALLFLGFRIEDWDFRVFFRSLRGREGRTLSQKYNHVAVQIDPEETRMLDPERARRYLEQYFEGAKISIYWGTVRDFIRELKDLWDRREAAA
jgi:CHAT domain/SIR2-like domain